MMRRNADVAPARWIQFRIGINLGDVLFEENDLFGDGVNVAARLQELAEPDSICVSGAVRDQVGDRLDDVIFADLGEQSVKNLVRRIRVYSVKLQSESAIAGDSVPRTAPPEVTKKPSMAGYRFSTSVATRSRNSSPMA